MDTEPEKNIHTGSSFADFIEEEGLEAEVSAKATARIAKTSTYSAAAPTADFGMIIEL